MMLNNDSVNNVDLMLQKPKKALIKMSMPLIVSLFVTSFYNLIDAAWVSGLGADALAGVGFFTPIFMILVGFGNGLGSGAAFAISKYLGEDDKVVTFAATPRDDDEETAEVEAAENEAVEAVNETEAAEISAESEE